MQALVIDDSRTVRMVIAQILREAGIDAIEAGDGAEALVQLGRHPDVGLMLVDWNMPVMNGIDFLRAVRARREFDEVRILMVTSEAAGDHVAMALKAGANEYLMKPFNKDVLLAKLQLLDILQE